MKIEYFEDSLGNLTKALVSEKRFNVMNFTPQKGTDNKVPVYALVLTDEIEAAIKQDA